MLLALLLLLLLLLSLLSLLLALALRPVPLLLRFESPAPRSLLSWFDAVAWLFRATASTFTTGGGGCDDERTNLRRC